MKDTLKMTAKELLQEIDATEDYLRELYIQYGRNLPTPIYNEREDDESEQDFEGKQNEIKESQWEESLKTY